VLFTGSSSDSDLSQIRVSGASRLDWATLIKRSLPHGHVAATLGMLRRIALDRLILSTAKGAASRRHCDLVVAMIVDRLITPRSKLGFVRAVDQETATSSLSTVLHLNEVREHEAYWTSYRMHQPVPKRYRGQGVSLMWDTMHTLIRRARN
jgi:hypothetical protein